MLLFICLAKTCPLYGVAVSSTSSLITFYMLAGRVQGCSSSSYIRSVDCGLFGRWMCRKNDVLDVLDRMSDQTKHFILFFSSNYRFLFKHFHRIIDVVRFCNGKRARTRHFDLVLEKQHEHVPKSSATAINKNMNLESPKFDFDTWVVVVAQSINNCDEFICWKSNRKNGQIVVGFSV